MTWKNIIEDEQQKPYYEKLKEEIDKRYENSIDFPETQNISKAYPLT
ncbi:uracil-DNA glycosylase, partial [Aliarcobacter butzleri]